MDMLQAYSNNLVDHHLILDLLPFLARAFFARRLPAPMSYGQAAILASLGLQQREVSDCEKDLKLPSSQVLALFNKVSRSLWAPGALDLRPELAAEGWNLCDRCNIGIG
jgi:N-acetyltransferase 10